MSDPLVQEIIVDPPPAHSDIQALIMQALMMPGVEETWVANGSKFGKTLGGVGGWTAAAIRCVKPRAYWRVVAPIYRQAQISLEYARMILPKDPRIVAVKRGQNSIYIAPEDKRLLEYKARLDFLHGQDPYSLEGEAVDGYLLDEAAKMSAKVYPSANTTRTRTGGPLMAISTPLGKNWFYHKCMEAKDQMHWAYRKGVAPKQLFITAPTSANPFIKPEIIAAAKRNMSDRLFRQYFLAEFVDDGTVFSNFRACTFGPPLETEGEHLMWIDPDASDCNVVIGCDWAQSVDWTVFFAIDFEHRRVVGYERFQKRPYTEAVRMLRKFGKRFKDVAEGLHDKTGVGVAIDEMCQSLPFPMTGVTFTNKSKSDMVNRLISRFELADLQIPNWGVLLSELDSFEGSLNGIGTISYSAPEGSHDDTVCALMLANAAMVSAEGLADVSYTDEDPAKLEDGDKGAYDRYLDDLTDDDDD